MIPKAGKICFWSNVTIKSIIGRQTGVVQSKVESY
jgi:hypothetical protein